MSRRNKLLLLALPLTIGIAADQVVRITLLGGGELRGRRIAPFDPPLFNGAQRESLARVRRLIESGATIDPASNVVFDAELGWTTPPNGGAGACHYDELGARRFGPTAAGGGGAAGARHLAVFGCSFTHGDEVEAADPWPARLAAERDDLRVSNFGVGAYGIDQALLRFLRVAESSRPDFVWLGLMPTASLRVVSVYRPALRHHAVSVSFKPRFRPSVGDRDSLELIPNPVLSLNDVPRLLTDQGAFFDAVGDADLFVRRFPAAYRPAGSHWSHAFATSRLLLTRAEGRGRNPAPWLLDADSEVHRTLRLLILRFRGEVEARGARFRLVILPDGKALAWHRQHGVGYWSGLTDELSESGIVVTDLTETLSMAGALDDRSFWMPGGHYSPAAHQVVSGALTDLLDRD